MSKFNTNVKTKVANPIATTAVKTVNHQGGEGFLRTPKAELFFAAASNFVEDTFYESSQDRSIRIRKLVSKVAVDDPIWMAQFVNWLRNKANLRSVSLQIALDAAKVMVDNGIAGSRSIVTSAMARADEPGEALGYWFANYGKRIPAAVKRGIADGARKLYNVKSIMKYDSKSASFRIGDVIQLTHPNPKNADQDKAFKFALDRLYNNADAISEVDSRSFDAATLNAHLKAGTLKDFVRESGMTWENVASAIGTSKEMWEQLYPTMGYMALLRNLRKFIDAGVDRRVLNAIAKRIANEDNVKASKQLPFRFWSAYDELKHTNFFSRELEDALDISTANIPALKGKTLILVDVSGSMTWHTSKHTKRSYMDTACLFGAVLAKRADDADLFTFDQGVYRTPFTKSMGVFSIVNDMYKTGGGTSLAHAVRNTYNKSYDRVIVLTDEQHNGRGVFSGVTCPVYVWNLGGYSPAASDQSNVFVQGGFDANSFNFIDMIEGLSENRWPWSLDDRADER